MDGQRRKAIDLNVEYEVERWWRSAMDKSRHVSTHAEVGGQPISRSSSSLAMKSPIPFSRTSSESIAAIVLAEPALVSLPPSPAHPHRDCCH